MGKTISLPFKGDLLKPMPRRKRKYVGLLDDGKVETNLEWTKELRRRIKLLFSHYGIDPKSDGARQSLAFALAFDLVPGLKEEQPESRGRKPIRNTAEATKAREELLADFEAMHGDNSALSDEAILIHIAKRWKKAGSKSRLAGKSSRTLRRELARARLDRSYKETAGGLFFPGSPGLFFANSKMPRYIGVGTRLLMGLDAPNEREKKD